MLLAHEWQKFLQTPTMMRPYAFDRVTVSGRPLGEGKPTPLFSIIGKCYSEYESGPSLYELAQTAGYLFGAGFYGLDSCRPLGYRG
jgi:hypothetical protein